MPGVGAICRYFFALRVLCKLLKKSGLQFSSLESRKFFTLFSQNWMTEIHTASRGFAKPRVLTLLNRGALRQVIAGSIFLHGGYRPGFLLLAGVASAALAILYFFMPETRNT